MWLCIFFKHRLFKRLSFISPLNSQIFLSGFGIRVMLVSQNEFESVLSCYFSEEFEKNWYSFFFDCLVQNSVVKPSASGLLFVGSLNITDSISLLVFGLFQFSISS